MYQDRGRRSRCGRARRCRSIGPLHRLPGVAGNCGRLVRAAKPAVVAPDLGGSGGFAAAGGIAFAKERTYGVFDVCLKSGTRAVEVLFIEKLVLPLASRVSRFGVDLAIDESDYVARRKAVGNVRD